MEDVTAVLITREQEYPEILLERLTCTDFFKDIIIVAECPSVYHRYLAAKKAETKYIFVIDDDAMVNFQVLWEKYDGRLTNTMTLPFQKAYEPLECTLVGWGTYFPKEMLGVFDKYIEKYGVDQTLLREADRIFTYLNRPFNTIIMPHEDLFQHQDRMSHDPDHFKCAHEALAKVKAIT